jgi:hypothetical protein
MGIKAATTPSLEERIRTLHEEIDAVVAKHVDAAAAAVPGVPRASVENSMLGRAGGCRCEEYRLIRKRETDAEELVRKQQADYALREG